MKTTVVFAIMLALGAGIGIAQEKKGPPRPGLTLTTTAFADGSEIPPKYTMSAPDGKAVSPKLEWTNVPDGTVTFALIFHDPDVALRKTTDDVLHWMAFNIPGTARELPEGMPATAEMPDGTIQVKTGRNIGYMGPGMGPAGPHHHYTFELYALDIKLDLGPDTTRADVLKAINGHILAKAIVMGRFHR